MKSNPPNVLWICTDQQRFDTLGCLGNPYVHTPNIDQLAANGTLFERCYVQSPICSPSRASFLTGRYPRTTRCRQNGQTIPDDEVLVTRLLADAGYVCGLSGKLHLSACNPAAVKDIEHRIDDGYAEFHWSHHPAPDWPTNAYIHWLHEKGVSYKTPVRDDCQYVQTGIPEEHHQTTWCAQKAINFIEANADFDHPWLFSVNIFDPHHAFDPPASYLERYLDRLDDIPLPNYTLGELAQKPIFQRVDHDGAYNTPGRYAFSEMREYDHQLIRAAYWAMIDLIDAQVGRMLAALEATGQLEDTLVIFTSDHGEMLGDHGVYAKGPHFYEPAVRVPLIVAWPGRVKAGQRVDAMVEMLDLTPALLDAAGLPHHPGMQGRSLWPLLTGEAGKTHREDVYCEYYNTAMHHDPRAYATMVRTDTFKLVKVHGLASGELYDLNEDPGETTNRWDDPAYQTVKLEMLERLCDRMAWTIDPLPVRKAPW